MSGESILGRWSRRKAEALTAPVAKRAEPASTEEPAIETLDLEVMEQTSEAAIAALTGDSDITVFLRKGVADWAKNAALRRAWAMDPMIRDFVGEARDYGYDWNSGEGVPGFGPILPSDNATSILQTMFSDVSLMEDKAADAETVGDDVASLDMVPPPSAAEELAARRERETVAGETLKVAAQEPAALVPTHDIAACEPREIEPTEVSDDHRPRRHGSATPV